MNKLNLFLLLFLIPIVSFGQKWGHATESDFTNEAMGLGIDSQGNTYTAGYITGETSFETNTVLQNAQGNGDIYITKYSALGDLVWVKQFGGNMSDRAYTLEVDKDDNIIVAGQYEGQVDFEGQIIQSTNNSRDIFILKLSSNGDVIWVRSEGGNGTENAYEISTDSQNNVILTGQFSGNTVLCNQSFTSLNNPTLNVPSYDLFISKFDENGSPIWVEVGQAIYEDRGMAVKTDSDDNVYLTGQFSDTLSFAGQQFNNNGYNVGFIMKLSPSGQFEWMNKLQAGMVLPYTMDINNSDEIVVSGDFRGTLYHQTTGGTTTLTSPHLNKIFVCKLNTSGDLFWHQALSSENELSSRSVVVDNEKNIFITGHFRCSFTELHLPNTALYNSVGERDIYLWRLNNEGAQSNVRQMGGKQNDYARGIVTRNTLEPIICGSYTNSLIVPSDNAVTYTIDNVNPFNLYSGSVGIPHIFLKGDESVNSFITSSLTNNTPDYNYFQTSPSDSLYGNISLFEDSLHACEDTIVKYSSYTFNQIGPDYNYLWSNGDTTYNSLISTSGFHYVEIERKDQCVSHSDTIYIELHSPPEFPLLSDSLGIKVLESPAYGEYTFCFPDSIDIWFNDLDSNLTFFVDGPGPTIYDTLTHNYTEEGTYYVNVSNQYCSSKSPFKINFDHVVYLDIIPYMVLEDTEDYNDSITICAGGFANVEILDSITNPTGTFNEHPSIPFIDYNWNIQSLYNFYNTSSAFSTQLHPDSTGWYTFSYEITVGYDNTCGIDTLTYSLTDSFYVEVLSAPSETLNISGELLCPNGSVFLHIPQTIDGLSWSGPSIEWTSTNGDSIQATSAGTYYYQGTQTDTTTGCSTQSNFTYSLVEKVPPLINANPSDGIACPYDSVLMWVDNDYVDYEWNGPSGSNLSQTNEHLDEEMGFYYCTVLDQEGCNLTTPPFEIKEYSAPYLSVDPTNAICEGEAVTISAVFMGSGNVTWLSPISGNSPIINVNQPGWYVAELTSCGITVTDSVEIVNGDFNISIIASDSILCYGESIQITAPPGYSNYEWSNNEVGTSQISVNETGNYSVSVMNEYGCITESNTVDIDFIEASVPPDSSTVVVCEDQTILLHNDSGLLTDWYTIDSVLVSTGIDLSVDISSDSSFLITHNQNYCPNYFSEINIDFVEPISDTFNIYGPNQLCENSSGIYYVNAVNESIEWMIADSILGNDQYLELGAEDISNDTLFALLSNECHTDTLFIEIEILTPESIDIVQDSLEVCAFSPIELYTNVNSTPLTWGGIAGTITDDTLSTVVGTNSGYIYAQFTDTNGCLSNIDSTYITVLYSPLIWQTEISGTCESDSVLLYVDSPAGSVTWTTPNQSYSDDSISFVLNDLNEGWYTLSVEDSLGCILSDSVEINSAPLPNIPFISDSIVCEGTPIPNEIYVDSNSTVILNQVVANQSGWYYFSVENNYGCSYSDSIFIEVLDCDQQFPNVITPNGDGSNDYYIVERALLEPKNLFIVLNRWGQTVFEESGYKNTFNGMNLSDGTYFYIYYPDYNSEPEQKYSGFFHLVR